MNNYLQCPSFKMLLLHFCLFICFGLFCIQAIAQEQPPKPITLEVNTLRNLNFGTFIQNGAYGTVTVSPDGVRSETLSIILPNSGWMATAALYEVKALPGTLITILSPDAQLLGSFGHLDLVLLKSNTGSPFIATKELTEVKIGGTLNVGPLSANPAGDYSCTFFVTFIQN